MASNSDFVLVGAGLPRNGTMSTRAALKLLLRGDIYHMMVVGMERYDHHPLWRQALNKTITKDGWKTILADYVGGVDYPVSHFYKEILEIYPEAKVLLNVRDPVKWYQSVRDSILDLSITQKSFPCNIFHHLMGTRGQTQLIWDLSDPVPSSSSAGLGLFSAVSAGQDTAVQFYKDHVEEVKRHVPADQLLVFEVKEGWEPLCKFLDVPVPDCPFPRVNDTETMNKAKRDIKILSWVMVVVIPLVIALGSYYSGASTFVPLVGYFLFVLLLRILGQSVWRVLFERVAKQKSKSA